MSKPTLLIRQSLFNRQRRHIAGSSSQQSSTSPQRRNVAAPKLATTAAKPFNEIPGPIALPMLRHSAHVLPRIGSYHHTVGLGLLEGLRDKYGDLVRLAKASRTRPVLYVFDPEMMREVRLLLDNAATEAHRYREVREAWAEGAGLLDVPIYRNAGLVYESYSTEPPRFEKSPLYQHRQGVGHCPVHGDEPKAIWAAIRALLQDGTLLKCYDQAFDDIAADTTRRLGDLRHAENALNDELETEIYRWAIETIGMMIFGIRLGCLDGPVHIPTADNQKPEKTSLDDEIHDLCSLSKRSLEELTPAERLVRCSRDIADGSYLVRSEGTLSPESSTFNSALKAFDRHFSLTEHFLLKALDSLNSGEVKPEQVLLDKLRPLQGRILPLATDILLAGVHPLAQTAINMFYQLSLHAARQQRAHDEVHWSIASREAGADCHELPYVAACAREAIRLHPATGGVVRRNREDIVVGGYEIPAGVDIVLAHGVTSKSEKQWGRAEAFVPERWCSEGWEPLKASRAHPFASLPFGEACPGTGAVGKMLASLTTRVLDKYRLEWHGPLPTMATVGVNRMHPPYYFVLQNAA